MKLTPKEEVSYCCGIVHRPDTCEAHSDQENHYRMGSIYKISILDKRSFMACIYILNVR